MRVIAITALLLSGCSSSATPPADVDAPPLSAGPGLKIESGAISLDSAAVVTAPASCPAGQLIQRGDSGWICTAAAANSMQLGGQPASAYLTTSSTVGDSAKLGGFPASHYLGVSARAADSGLLNGRPPSDFLAATAQAVSAANADHATVADSATNATHATSATSATTAANASHASSADSATNAGQLNGVAASQYLRNDIANQSVPGTVTVGNPNGTRVVLLAQGPSGGGIFGSNNASGNFHLDSDSGGSDGHIYLDWFSGRGVVFGNGAGGSVGSIDTRGNFLANGTVSAGGDLSTGGNVSAVSFNGMQIFQLANGNTPTGVGCNRICDTNNGATGSGFSTCLAAKFSNAAGAVPTTNTPCSTSTSLSSTWSFACMCAKF